MSIPFSVILQDGCFCTRPELSCIGIPQSSHEVPSVLCGGSVFDFLIFPMNFLLLLCCGRRFCEYTAHRTHMPGCQGRPSASLPPSLPLNQDKTTTGSGNTSLVSGLWSRIGISVCTYSIRCVFRLLLLLFFHVVSEIENWLMKVGRLLYVHSLHMQVRGASPENESASDFSDTLTRDIHSRQRRSHTNKPGTPGYYLNQETFCSFFGPDVDMDDVEIDAGMDVC